MNKQSTSKKQFSSKVQIDELLNNLFDRYQDSFEKQRWPWEPQRWYELVYCLFSTIEGHFGPQARSISAIRVLMELGLLEVSVLAKANETTNLHIGIVLERIGFSKNQVAQIKKGLFDLATYLEETYNGKIQLLLRTFGMELVKKVLQVLPLEDSVGKKNALLVVTHWLQHVLDLPVLVHSPGVEKLLSETGAKVEEVFASADERNINIGLVDEILNRWISEHPSNNGEEFLLLQKEAVSRRRRVYG